jgi:hypothetical protein
LDMLAASASPTIAAILTIRFLPKKPSTIAGIISS